MNKKLSYHFSDKQIHSVENTRLDLYKKSSGNVVNFLLNAEISVIRKGKRPELVNSLAYYLKEVGLTYRCSAVYTTCTYSGCNEINIRKVI